MEHTAQALLELLVARGLSVATAESLTGGLLCSELVSVPGASRAVLGGVISYATAVKVEVLGVPSSIVAEHGVVSSACADAMARGVRTHLGADVGIATTGVAGPEVQDGQAVGTVFVAVASSHGVEVTRLALTGERQEIRDAACRAALGLTHRHVAAHTP